MKNTIQKIPLLLVVIACLTLGLAPFRPPHVWEKLQMLRAGNLSAPVDIFDLLMHGSPWVLLVVLLLMKLLPGRAR